MCKFEQKCVGKECYAIGIPDSRWYGVVTLKSQTKFLEFTKTELKFQKYLFPGCSP